MILSLSTYAQVYDSVATQGNDVFFNLNTGDQTMVDANSWDIGFTTAGFDASIIVNETKGLKLYVYSDDTTEWNTVDTSGFDFEANQVYNSVTSWENGAFANLGVAFPDYGWGTYDQSNHSLNGNRIFLLEMTDGSLVQIEITELTVGGMFTVKTSDLGGANTYYSNVNKNSYGTKNFVYFNVANRTIVDEEPASEDWHLLFTKFYAEIQAGPSLVYYNVAGVKINKGLMVAERSGVDVSDNDTNALDWNEDITEIGYDWKSFNNSTFQYEITQDLSYFVKNDKGDVWKIWFTDYGSSTYYFNYQKIGHNASVKSLKMLNSKVYPVPANDVLFIENKETEFSVVALRTLQGVTVQTTNIGALEVKPLDVSGLTPGYYILTISNDKMISTHKIIIE